jgi:hypothetical protein
VNRVIGWFADFFRFAWGLFYWNTRKSLFRIRGGRGRHPCQNASDSGRALETQCDACLHWDKPARFASVCPLLVATPRGLRCSAHAADVRPFWGRTARYYGSSLLALYLAGALGVFVFLRSIGYPVSILHLAWPGLWYRVPQVRSAYFFEKGNQAFAAGRIKEGLLYFDNAYKFDPANYLAGLALARNYQTTHTAISDAVFTRLYYEHPRQRAATAQDWFRALLARGDFPKVAELAARELIADPGHASPWMRALVFATRQTGDAAPLTALLASKDPAAAPWHQLITTELVARGPDRNALARALRAPWPLNAPAYARYYQIEGLIALGDHFNALDQLGRQVGRLDEETALGLRLAAYARAGSKSQLTYEFNVLLTRPLTPPVIKLLTAHLVRYPDPALFAHLYDKFERANLPLTTDNAGSHFSVLCVAGVHQDRVRLRALILRLKDLASASFLRLNLVEDFFNNESPAKRISTFLPILPVPLEVTYALLERYPGVTRAAPPNARQP